MLHQELAHSLSHVLILPTSSIHPAWFCTRECVSHPFPRTPCIRPWVPALRVVIGALVPMAYKPPAQNRALDHLLLFLAFVSLGAPAACLPASSRCARLSTTSCPSRVLSPISWETVGPGLARGRALFPPAQRSRLRTHVLPVFCTVSSPSSKMVYHRVRLPPQCHTAHCTRGKLGLSVAWLGTVRFLCRSHGGFVHVGRNVRDAEKRHDLHQ